MKASVLVESGKLQYMDVPEERVENNLAKVKVAYTGICGSDVPRVLKNGAHYYPIILGHEFSGIVEEIGGNVKSLEVGDHVVGIPLKPCGTCEDCKKGNYSLCKNYTFYGSRKNGSYAEKIVLPEENLFKISKDIPLKYAAFFEPITIGYHGIKQANYKSGKTVAILGSGAIGLFTIQIVKNLGASKIVAFNRSKSKINLSKKLGADECISTLDENFKEKAMELTNKRGFDYIFETAGSTETMKESFELIANKGTVCLIGTPTDNITFAPKLWEQLNRKEFYLTGSWMSYSSPFPGEEWRESERMLAEKKLKIDDEMIYKIYDLENVQKAFEEYKEGKVKGKILIKCNK